MSDPAPTATFLNLPGAKRARVVDAAVAEFATRAYPDASMDRIAAVAGVAKGSLYQYFGGKAELYGWLLMDYLPERKRASFDVEATAAAGDPFAALEASFRAGVELFAREPLLARLGAQVLAPGADPAIEPFHRTLRTGTHLALVRLVRRAQEAGQVRSEVDAVDGAVLLEHLLGAGLLEALARRAGSDLQGLTADPARMVHALDEAERERTVRAFLDLVRRALAPAAPPSPEAAADGAREEPDGAKDGRRVRRARRRR